MNATKANTIRCCSKHDDPHALQGGTGDASSSPPQHEAPATPAATTADSAAAAPAPAPAPEAASTSARQGDVSLLTTAEPIDRLRYQAVLVFDYFDTAKAGRLTAEQVQAFFTWSSRKVCCNINSWLPPPLAGMPQRGPSCRAPMYAMV